MLQESTSTLCKRHPTWNSGVVSPISEAIRKWGLTAKFSTERNFWPELGKRAGYNVSEVTLMFIYNTHFFGVKVNPSTAESQEKIGTQQVLNTESRAHGVHTAHKEMVKLFQIINCRKYFSIQIQSKEIFRIISFVQRTPYFLMFLFSCPGEELDG